MARSMEQSDFAIVRDADVELPPSTDPIVLTVAPSSEASEFATRWVMRVTVVLLAALALLCAIGPHIPAGE